MAYAIGIDLGGTSIKSALVDERGDTFFEEVIPSCASVSAQAVLRQLENAASSLKDKAADRGWKVNGIGLGTPGIVDRTGRIVLGGAENIDGWENIDVATPLEERLGLPVVIGNDANMMGLGEVKFGSGRGCTHVVFLTVGTGIGGAVIIDGKLFSGYDGRGTELGHVPLFADGERCACGATGCLEHYASTSALVRRFRESVKEQSPVSGAPADGELIVRLYREGFPPAVKCMKEHFYYLGRGIAGFINIFSPQRVVIGGGISESGPFYIEEIKKAVRQQVMASCAVNTEIVASSLGNRAGLVGAASLILEDVLKK